MTEKYILVSDDEYCYTLDTESGDYKTLEDFEKQEFENAKLDGIDIKEYEDAILQSASDKYWDWVYNGHLEADTCNDIMNELHEENQQLREIVKTSYFNEICEQCKYGHYFATCIPGEPLEWDFECTKKHFGNDHWRCDCLTECDDFELKDLKELLGDKE